MYFEEEHGFIKQSLKVEEKIFESRSDYQNIEVYKSKELGNILVLDKNAMMSEKDEFIYHEMLSHVPICTHREPKKVLIIGGGDGGTAREVLRHPDLEVDMVEIDREVVEVSKKFFPDNGDWDNERLNLVIADGVKFIAEAEDKSYDIILVDSTDDKNQASGLFESAFYAQANRVLKDDGLIAVQGSSYFVDIEQHKSILKRMGSLFGIVMPYRYEMLTYPGVVWNFILASKKYHPTADIILQRADLIEGLSYYNSDIHRASFAVPAYIKKELLGIAKN
jgi:spermidine synthase